MQFFMEQVILRLAVDFPSRHIYAVSVIHSTFYPAYMSLIVVLSSGIKQQVYEAFHVPPPKAKGKNAWGFTSTPYVFMKQHLGTERLYSAKNLVIVSTMSLVERYCNGKLNTLLYMI
jgi:hypothetical protein